MEKIKLYLDTSVISYLDQQDTPDKMKITQEFWENLKNNERYQILISDTVLDEIRNSQPEKKVTLENYIKEINYNQLHLTDNIGDLAEEIIDRGILPPKSIQDSYHIAFALSNECDYILSWNFKHLINSRARNGVRNLTQLLGFKAPDLVSPQEFFESELKE